MSCPFEAEVCLLLDDELPFGRRMVVEAHLAVCPSCAALEETLDRVEHQLRHGPARPLGVVEPALARIAQPSRGSLRAGVIVAAAAAALVALFVWPDAPSPTRRRTPEAPVVVAEAPVLPPPVLPDATLAERVAVLAPHDKEGAERVAEDVRRAGAAGTSALARLLDDDDPERIERALLVAERAPSPRLEGRLVALLERPAFAARAARLLGVAGGTRAVPALADLLDGPAGVEAREALVAIGGRAAVDALAAHHVAARAAESLDALARLDPDLAARELLLADEALAKRVLARRSVSLAPALRRLAGESRTAAAAARALGWAGDVASAPLLGDLARRRSTARAAAGALLALDRPEATARAVRAYRLGAAPESVAAAFVGRASAEPHLLRIVRAGAAHERVAALELLGRCGGAATLRALSRTRLRGREQVAAATTLGAIGGADAVALLAAWRDAPGMRRHVVAALGATRDPAAVPVLASLAPDADVCAALGRIHDGASARALIDHLLARRFRRAARAGLRAMPLRVVVPELLARFAHEGESWTLRIVLKEIAGADYGSRVGPWQQWWDSRP